MATSCTENTIVNKVTQVNSDIAEMTLKKLRQADRAIPVPFTLNLGEGFPILQCDEVIRVIPNKRLVAFGKWDNQPIVAKLFYGHKKRAKHHFDQEISGVNALINSGIPTPKLLWKGAVHNQKIYVLIFERIEGAKSLDEIWQKKRSPEELTDLMKSMTVELATQHVLGIIQRDLHLKNFLVTDKQIYTIDGGNINHLNHILSIDQSLDHLGLFFSQLGVGTEALQEELFQTYAQSRSWLVKQTHINTLQKAIYKWTKKRWQDYEEKIQRNSTSFVRHATLTSLTMYDRGYYSAQFKKFLANPEEFFNHKTTKILKAGRSSTIAKIKIDDRYLVVKRYNIKSFWHGLRRCLRSTRAAKSWQIAQRLTLFGIPTPKPIAFIEKRFFGLRSKSYFVMEYIDGIHAGKYFEKYPIEQEKLNVVAKRIVTMLLNLPKLRLAHGDLKMTNILIENQRPVLIDFDGVTEYQTLFGLNRAFREEVQRFLRNWKKQPDLQSFFKELINEQMR